MKNWFSSLFNVAESGAKFAYEVDDESVDFHCPEYQFNKIKNGQPMNLSQPSL